MFKAEVYQVMLECLGGIIEELLVALFFSNFNDEKNTIPFELRRVVAFKEKINDQCCCIEYSGVTDFAQRLSEFLMEW